MKVMITTTKRPDTLAAYYTRHLSTIQGIELVPVYTFDFEDEYVQNMFFRKVQAHFFPAVLTREVTAKLEQEVLEYKPDVLIIVKGLYISPGLLERLKRRGVFLVNYNPDHPIYFETRASGNANIKKAIPHYNLLFTYSPVIQAALKAYMPRLVTAVLPFGYEESKYSKNDISGKALIKRVCFAGTGDKARAKFIYDLISHKVPVDIYGKGYSKYLDVKSDYLTLLPEVSGDEYLGRLQQYSIALNLYREQNRGGHNMRSFEIPSVGGVQLVEYSRQMDDLFKNGEEIYLYRNSEELYGMISEILQFSDDHLVDMKHRVRDKTLHSQFSYRHRALQMMEVISAKL